MEYELMSVEAIKTIMSYEVLQTVMVLLFFLLLIGIVSSLGGLRKSQKYRKFLADMYVSGKIRKFAKKDDINLIEEEDRFKSWLKKRGPEIQELDNVVEDDLKDRIEADSVEKLKKTGKKLDKKK